MKIIKKRAISPAIATIMLLGITIIAGAAVFTTVYLVMNNKDPANLTINEPISYATTETNMAYYDSAIDSILLSLTDNNKEPLIIDLNNIVVYNETGHQALDSWYVSSTNQEIIIQGSETLPLNLITDAQYDTYEFQVGQQFYITVPAKKITDKNYEIFTSKVFTVDSLRTQPLYQLVTVNSANQDGNNVYIIGTNLDNKTITTQINFAIINYGKADKEKTFPVTLQLENTTLFNATTNYQLLTVPASGPTNTDTNCDPGEACIQGSFTITKKNITREKDTYWADISIGQESQSFNITFVEQIPQYYLTMPNNRGKDNNQQGNVLQFNSNKYWETETLVLVMTVWNNETYSSPLSATLELSDVNTTAFSLDSTASITQTVPAGNYLTSIPDQNNKCGIGQTKNAACADYTWTITRQIIQTKDQKNPTVYYTVQQPYYYFKVRWVEANIEFIIPVQVNPP